MFTIYLVSAAIFYVFVAKCAPVIRETETGARQVPCEVIELYVASADRAASRAA